MAGLNISPRRCRKEGWRAGWHGDPNAVKRVFNQIENAGKEAEKRIQYEQERLKPSIAAYQGLVGDPGAVENPLRSRKTAYDLFILGVFFLLSVIGEFLAAYIISEGVDDVMQRIGLVAVFLLPPAIGAYLLFERFFSFWREWRSPREGRFDSADAIETLVALVLYVLITIGCFFNSLSRGAIFSFLYSEGGSQVGKAVSYMGYGMVSILFVLPTITGFILHRIHEKFSLSRAGTKTFRDYLRLRDEYKRHDLDRDLIPHRVSAVKAEVVSAFHRGIRWRNFLLRDGIEIPGDMFGKKGGSDERARRVIDVDSTE